MLNGKFISCKAIIAKVYRNLKLKDEEPFTDMIEWLAEALDFIHVYPQYVHKPGVLHFNNYKAEVPNDFIGLEAAEYNGLNARYTTNSFGPQDRTKTGRYLTPYSYNQDKIANVLLVTSKYYLGPEVSFSIQDGWFKSSFKEGCMNINYVAMETDCDGYPLVPDHVSFTEALYWYIVYKYLYPKALNGEIASQFYEDAFQKWQYYCNQAGAEALMPDLITLENIKRSYLSLRLQPNLFDNFYNELNKNY